MATEYPFLCDLLGEDWMKREILGDAPKHDLGVWQKRNPQIPVVAHVEQLLEYLFAKGNVKFNAERLAQKLNAEFASTLAELEWAVWLAERDFTVIVEPSAPKRGPDLEARKDHAYFIEIRTVGLSDRDERFNLTSKDVFSRLEKIRSRYLVSISMGAGYAAYSKELKAAITAVADTLVGELRREPVERATLYYFSQEEKVLSIGGDIELPPIDYGNPQEVLDKVKRYERARKAGFVARFYDLGEEGETRVMNMGAGPAYDDTHIRFRRILERKRAQLPTNQRGVIVLDVSGLMLSEDSVLSALYGDLQMQFAVGRDGMVGEPGWNRAPNGFFRNTSRVSAVVVYRREFSGDRAAVQTARYVFPTDRADPDTMQLTLPQLESFGEVPANMRQLSAENLPPQAS